MMICMAECRKFDEVTSDLDCYLMGSDYKHDKQYHAFRLALHNTAQDLRPSQSLMTSVMVLETIYAMWILSVIIRFSNAHGPRIRAPLDLEVDLAPMLQYFETTDMTLEELYCDVYRANLPGYLGQDFGCRGHNQIRDTYHALKFYHRSIVIPTEDGSGPTVARIIRLHNEIVNSTCKLSR